MKNSIIRVHIALLSVTAIYGANYSIAKEVMPEYIGASGFIFIRVVTAFILFYLIQKIFIAEKIQCRSDYIRLFFCGMLGVAGNMLFFFHGLSLTHPVNAALIMTLSPVFVLLFAVIIKVEKLSMLKSIGMLLGGTGAALMIAGPALIADTGLRLGDLFVFINAAFYAAYLVLVKPLMQKYQSLTVIRWTFFFGALIVVPIGLPDMISARWQDLTMELWVSIAFVVIGTTFIAYLLNAWALGYVRSSVVGSYIYLQPVMAAFFAVFLAGYLLSWEQVFYAVLIFAGVYLVSKPGKTSEIAKIK